MAVVEVDIAGEDIYRDAYEGHVVPVVVDDDEVDYPVTIWPPAPQLDTEDGR